LAALGCTCYCYWVYPLFFIWGEAMTREEREGKNPILPHPALAVKEILVLTPQILIIAKHDLALLRIFTTRAY